MPSDSIKADDMAQLVTPLVLGEPDAMITASQLCALYLMYTLRQLCYAADLLQQACRYLTRVLLTLCPL